MAALTITKAVLENGSRIYRATYNFVGDGSNTISGYVAADPTATGDMGVSIAGNTLYPKTGLRIARVRYNLAAGFSIRIQWNATADTDAINLFGFGKQSFITEGCLTPYSSGVTLIAGATGKILFTQAPTAALAAGTAGFIELVLRKGIQQ